MNENLSVGLGVSFINATLEQKTAIQNLANGQSDGQLTLDSDDWEVGYNLGLLYELSERTRFGLTYRSEINFDDTFHLTLGLQYQIDTPFLLSMGIASDESPVTDSNRTPDLPLDRQCIRWIERPKKPNSQIVFIFLST